LGRDHDNINIRRRNNGFEMNAETVREAEDLTFHEIRLDGRTVQRSMGLIGRDNLKPVGLLGSFGGGENGKTVSLCLLCTLAGRIETNDHVIPAVTQVLGLGMSLAAISKNGD